METIDPIKLGLIKTLARAANLSSLINRDLSDKKEDKQNSILDVIKNLLLPSY